MEVLFLTVGVCVSTLCYFCYNFIMYRREESLRIQKLNLKIQTLLDGSSRNFKENNVFRKLAINEMSKQKLVYVPETGRYERRKQIN